MGKKVVPKEAQGPSQNLKKAVSVDLQRHPGVTNRGLAGQRGAVVTWVFVPASLLEASQLCSE